MLYYIVYKVLLWGEKGGVLTVPLYKDDSYIADRIRNTVKVLELTGLDRLVCVLAVDYGASEAALSALREQYKNSKLVFICDVAQLRYMCELLGKRRENQ